MIAVRPATSEDIPQVGDLIRQQYLLQQRYDCAFQLTPDVDWAQHVASNMAQSSSMILVAEKDGDLVGYVHIRVA